LATIILTYYNKTKSRVTTKIKNDSNIKSRPCEIFFAVNSFATIILMDYNITKLAFTIKIKNNSNIKSLSCEIFLQ
jgi:hypothetical protein